MGSVRVRSLRRDGGGSAGEREMGSRTALALSDVPAAGWGGEEKHTFHGSGGRSDANPIGRYFLSFSLEPESISLAAGLFVKHCDQGGHYA